MCWLLMTAYLFNVLKRIRWVLYISTQSLRVYGPQFLAFGLIMEIYIVKTPNMRTFHAENWSALFNNPFVLNASFFYSLKTSENRKGALGKNGLK